MKIVVVSDTHQIHHQIEMPPGDMIIHAGDAGIDGTKEELDDFIKWFSKLPYQYKIMVGGNHDEYLEDHPEIFEGTGIHFLWDRLIEISGLRIYGSPWRIVTDERMYQTEKRIAKAARSGIRKPGKGGDGRAAFMITETWAEHIWREIPAALDILITHNPPFGIMDFDGKKYRGSCALLNAVRSRKIRYHIFGHVHPGHGIVSDRTTFVNAAICANYCYSPEHKPIVLEIE